MLLLGNVFCTDLVTFCALRGASSWEWSDTLSLVRPFVPTSGTAKIHYREVTEIG